MTTIATIRHHTVAGSLYPPLIIRGLAMGDIRPGDWWRVLPRELGQGVVLGLFLASVGMARVWAWGDGLHHVLDGRTGLPVREVAATWVLASSALVADGLATALFLAEPAALAERYAFRYVRMFTDGTAEWSADLPGEVFAA